MIKTPAEILKAARKEAGFENAAEAAREFEWAESTYTSHENGTRGISKKMARKYARAFKISAGVLLEVAGDTEDVGTERNVLVIGETAVGLWRDTTLDIEHDKTRPSLRLPDIGGSGRRRQAVKAGDNSANRAVRAGEYAVFEHLEPDEVIELPIAALVIVDRIRGHLRERTIRRVRTRTGAKIEMESYSTERRYAEVLTWPATKSGEKIEIVGRVVGKYADFTD